MRKLYSVIALVMVLLIIDMPIYTAATVSGILNYKISGTDGISKTVRNKDMLDVEATVHVVNDSMITPDQIWLGGTTPFDSCEKNGEGYLCKLRYPKKEREFANREPFTINLHSDAHSNPTSSFTIIDSKSGYVVQDKFPPRIEATVDKTKSRDTIKVTFRGYDDSYAVNKYEYCSGIKTLEFFSDDRKITKVYNYEPNLCMADGDFTIDTTLLPEAKYNLTVQAIDYKGNTAKTSFSLEVDRTGARFSNLKVLDVTGEEINHVGTDFINAMILVSVTDDVKLETIKADLSSLNDKANYKDLPGMCEPVDDYLLCIWNIQIVPTAYGTKNLVFKGQDIINNANDQTMVKVLQKDTDGPRVVKLSTGIFGNNVNYLRPFNNTIEVVFSESGCGLNKDEVFLDLSSLGGGQYVKPDSCEQGWKCTWKNLNFNAADGIYTISVSPQTKDRLGNRLVQAFTKEVVFDTSAPQLVSLEITTIRSGINKYEGITLFGDSLQYKATLLEPGYLRDAYGDFSVIVKDAHVIEANECKQMSGGLWECTWLTDPIDVDGYIKDKTKLTFGDYLGNEISYTAEVIVYSIQQTYTDYWSHEVTCSPPAIDREVTSLIDQRIYCNIHLSGNAQVISMSMGECTGDNSTKYIKKKELINNQPGTRDPYLKLTLNPADIKLDRLSLTCPLIIISKAGTSITSVPEIEEVEISVPFYNSPLGEYGKNMEEKIDDAIDDANGGVWKAITALNKVIFYSERVCSLITMVNNIASLFNAIGFYKRVTGEGMSAVNPAAGQVVEKAGMGDQSIASVLNNQMKTEFIGKEGSGTAFVGKFCKFMSCRLFYDEIWQSPDKNRAESGKANIRDSIGSWQRSVLGFANTVSTGGSFGETIGLGGQGVNAYTYQYKTTDQRGGTSPSLLLQGGKLNPKDSIVLSFATLCIPGIVYNLEKYRQIKCMYADCLQTSVETGVPIYACEDAKEYQTCKYVYGEIFQLLPFTGLFDYFLGLVKGVLYNPFGILDLLIGYKCTTSVWSSGQAGIAKLCLFQEVTGMIADIWQDIANLKDDWKIKEDYCARISDDDNDDDDKDTKGKGGLFG